MKKRPKTIFCPRLMAMVLSVALLFGAYTPYTVFAETTMGTISINGHGKISVSPDIATVNIGVQTEDIDASTAQQENAKVMDNVIAALKDIGVSEDDIKTASYSMRPKYDYVHNPRLGYSEPVAAGYTVSSYLNVTIRDISKVGVILDETGKAGANATYGLSFNISNPEVYYAQALTAAIANAQDKSETIASALGVSINRVISVSEQGFSNVSPIFTETASFDTAGSVESVRTPIEVGQLEISAFVNVIYDYNNN